MEFRALIERNIKCSNIYKVFEKEGTYTINLSIPFRIHDVIFSAWQDYTTNDENEAPPSPILVNIYIDEYPLTSFWLFKGTSGCQFSMAPIGQSGIKIELVGEVKYPIFCCITYENLEDFFNELK